MDSLSDDEFLQAVDGGTLEDGFTHRAHVRLAWILVSRHGIGVGGDKMIHAIQQLAVRADAPQKFHKTLTWAFILLVAEAIDRTPDLSSWLDFADAHPGLLQWPNQALTSRWSEDLLSLPAARTRLLLPDRAPGGPR